MKVNVLLRTIGFLCVFLSSNSLFALPSTRPATIGQGGDSVATQLHYPAKERAAKEQGAVKFYCEVSPEGKPGHISTLAGKGDTRFGKAVEFALHHGRFIPAMVQGKPAAVLVGGTVLFMMPNGQPTIAVVLATAETEKVAAMSNYVQPQIVDTDALFRRKIFSHRDKYHLQYGAHPAASVRVHVDAEGRMTSKKIDSESPPNGGHGRLVLDVMNEEHFLPAQSNGQAIAGDLEITVDFEHMVDPDRAEPVGSLIKKDGE